MYRIKTLNKIASIGLAQLDKGRFVVEEDCANPDGILVRSAKMHDYEFPPALRAIAGPGPAPTTSPSTGAARRASWSSTPPAPTPTP